MSKTTFETITDEQIRALRDEVREGGDMVQFVICNRALGETSEVAIAPWEEAKVGRALLMPRDATRAECARVIAEARAQE